jgi:NitT/TauT family transport system ATP-binding protein
MIDIKNLTFAYDKETPTLKDVSLSIAPDSFTILVGASGSGKTTLLRLVAGLLKTGMGSVDIKGKVAMVFQNGALLPWRTARENIALPLLALGEKQQSIDKKTAVALARVGLTELADKYPRELSGGERQRVGIARALAVEPGILLLDEPFSALDVNTAERLRIDLMKIWQELKLTVLMVSHSVEEAAELAQVVYALKDGHLKEPIQITLPYPRNITSLEYIQDVQRIKSAV